MTTWYEDYRPRVYFDLTRPKGINKWLEMFKKISQENI